MTAPKVQALRIQRGDDVTLTITFDQDVSQFSDVWFTVREAWATTEANDVDAVFSANLADMQVVSARVVSVLLPHASTRDWAFDSYVYDVQVKSLAGKLFTTQRGSLAVTPDVTRST